MYFIMYNSNVDKYYILGRYQYKRYIKKSRRKKDICKKNVCKEGIYQRDMQIYTTHANNMVSIYYQRLI